MKIKKILKMWMCWVRDEQFMTIMMNVSYMPDKNGDYRKGYLDGLKYSESKLGLLALENNIDLRNVGKINKNNIS